MEYPPAPLKQPDVPVMARENGLRSGVTSSDDALDRTDVDALDFRRRIGLMILILDLSQRTARYASSERTEEIASNIKLPPP